MLMQRLDLTRAEPAPTYVCHPRAAGPGCGAEVPVSLTRCPRCKTVQQRPLAPVSGGDVITNAVLYDAGRPVALVAEVGPEAAGFIATQARSFAGRNTRGRPRLSGLGDRQAMFGTLQPQPLRQRYGCTRSQVARKTNPAAWLAVATECHAILADALPQVAAHNLDVASGVAECWRWAGTGWTSGVLNLTQVLPYHRDSGNLAGSWSAMIGARSSGVDGGHLYLPEYDVTLGVGNRSLICFPGADVVHGVTPLTVGANAWRVTAVFYGLRGCLECEPSLEAEMARASARATVRARAISDGASPQGARNAKRAKPVRATSQKSEQEHLDDLVEFSRLMLASGDLEPWAELLRQLHDDGAINREELLWLIKLYNSFDSLGSAWAAFQRWRTSYEWADALDRDEIAKYDCTQERRNLRGGLVIKSLDHYVKLCRRAGTPEDWLRQGLRTGRPGADFTVLCHHLRQVWGVGRQAAFEWAEFLEKAAGFPVRATNAMLWESEGPRRSLQRLYGNPNPTAAWLDARAVECKRYLADRGVVMSWEDFETAICDFNVGRDGRYYVGRHLAALREEINGITEGRGWLDDAWRKVVPAPWCDIAPGIDPDLMPVYRDTGRLIDTPNPTKETTP